MSTHKACFSKRSFFGQVDFAFIARLFWALQAILGLFSFSPTSPLTCYKSVLSGSFLSLTDLT